MIIAFSGTDGAGKSTQIERLKNVLDARGTPQRFVWARGGYTPIMLRLKGLVLRILGRKGGGKTLQAAGAGPYNQKRQKLLRRKFVARVWLSLAIIDLALLYGVYVRLLSWRGIVVLCDRYVGDTKIDFLRNFPDHFNPSGILWRGLMWLAPRPSVHFLLTVPCDISAQRSRQKNEPFPDSRETLEFRLNQYLTAAAFSDPEIVRIEGTDSIDDIAAEILRRVDTKIAVAMP